jgi:hypothetical protein
VAERSDILYLQLLNTATAIPLMSPHPLSHSCGANEGNPPLAGEQGRLIDSLKYHAQAVLCQCMGHVNNSNKARFTSMMLRPNVLNSRLLVQARASLRFKFPEHPGLGQTLKSFSFSFFFQSQDLTRLTGTGQAPRHLLAPLAESGVAPWGSILVRCSTENKFEA